MNLRYKIFSGHIILMAVICSMVIVLVHERQRMREIGMETSKLRTVRRDINIAHRRITGLAMQGEGVLGWNEEDCLRYHTRRLQTDSLLNVLKNHCHEYVRPEQIDSLRTLLAVKEMHLLHIIKMFEQHYQADSLLVNRLPEVAKRVTHVSTITQKKEGIAGIFGGKRTIQVLPSAHELYAFSDSLIALQQTQATEMETYIDSIRIQNRTLNQKLSQLIKNLDEQAQMIFAQKEQNMEEARNLSFHMFALIILLAIILLLVLFFVIRSDLHKEEQIKTKLNKVICENEELLEMRKRIILTVSHDIRGPLGNIHNCADLASQTREKKKREPYLDDIRHSCEHILHLVNDLMDAYRINEAGDLRNDTVFYLDRFLQRISDEFSRKAISKALILYSVHENSSITVKGDADKLEQILANLLTNAIKFTPSGSISFHSKYLEGKLQVEIKDTGIGMDEETLKRIFSPFERAAQNVNSEGFGLGLFLTKGLIKVLDGTINVESALGKGSIFRIEVPLPETDEVVEEYIPDRSSITILPKKILVVDDDPIQLKIAEDMLVRNGITCTTCMNVRDVVAAIRQSDYDMVLTDVQMPDTDGFALLRLLRNSDIRNSKTIPIAVMTARSDSYTGIYEKEGFAGCIHKPFNIHSLLTFLSTVMSRTKVSNAGEFDFSRLLEDTDEKKYMLFLVIDESRKELDGLSSALKEFDREFMRKIIHRMVPVWEMLGKESLLYDFQERLHDMDTNDETISEQSIMIMEWIEKLIIEAENELKKHEDINC